MGYRHSSAKLNYEKLAEWALKRKGEVIFCEGEYADYLPFRPLVDQKGVAGKISREVIFYKTGVKSRNWKQLELFSPQE